MKNENKIRLSFYVAVDCFDNYAIAMSVLIGFRMNSKSTKKTHILCLQFLNDINISNRQIKKE